MPDARWQRRLILRAFAAAFFQVERRFAVVRLDRRLASGSVTATISDPRFDVPTTIDAFGGGLYLVNARFNTPPTPDTTYTIVRVENRRR